MSSSVSHQYPPAPSLTTHAASGIVAGEGTFVGVPSSTLYIQNLNEKLAIPLLQKELFNAFCPFGKIMDIKIKRNLKMKGQAFIAFELTEDASKALVARQGSIILHKPIVVRFARFKSYISSKRDGTYEEQRSKQDAYKGAHFIFIYHPSKSISRSKTNKISIVASNIDVTVYW